MASECARRRIGRRGSGPRPASGFVLAVTLWILAGIAIAVGLMTLWSLQQLEQARREAERQGLLQADETRLVATAKGQLFLNDLLQFFSLAWVVSPFLILGNK